MKYPSVTNVFESRKELTKHIDTFCRSNGLPGFAHIPNGRLHVLYKCKESKCQGRIEANQEVRKVDGKTTTKGTKVTVTKSVECQCMCIPLQALEVNRTFDTWESARNAITRYCSKELKKGAYTLADNNATYRHYKCTSNQCAYYPGCEGKVLVKCLDGKKNRYPLLSRATTNRHRHLVKIVFCVLKKV